MCIKGLLHVFVFTYLANFLLNALLTNIGAAFLCESMFLARKQPKHCVSAGMLSFHPSLSPSSAAMESYSTLQRCSMMGQVDAQSLGTGSCYFVVPCTLSDKSKALFLWWRSIPGKKDPFSMQVDSFSKARTLFSALLPWCVIPRLVLYKALSPAVFLILLWIACSGNRQLTQSSDLIFSLGVLLQGK